MAYSTASLSADQLAWMADDKPIFAFNQFHSRSSTVKWAESLNTAATDRSPAGAPASWGHDGFLDDLTYPDVIHSSASWYFLVDLWADNEISFDAVGIIGHNCNTKGVDTVYLHVDDASNFPSPTTVTLWDSISDDKRMFCWDLDVSGAAKRFSNVRYLAIEFERSAGGYTAPTLGELLLLRRCQLPRVPANPFDNLERTKKTQRFTSPSGIQSVDEHYLDQARIRGSLRVGKDEPVDDWRDGLQTAHGLGAWCYEPTTNPDDTHIVELPEDSYLPTAGFAERTISFDVLEQGPDDYFLAKGTY